MHQVFNYVEVEDLNHIYQRRSKYIDLIVAIPNLLQCIKGSKLFKIHKVVNMDHRLYVVKCKFGNTF